MYRFSEEADAVMRCANQEAQKLNHNYVGTEHILLGLLKRSSPNTSKVFDRLDVHPSKIRLELERLILVGEESDSKMQRPNTSMANRVLDIAWDEVKARKEDMIGQEHLLLALACEKEGIAGQVLRSLGLKHSKLKTEFKKVKAGKQSSATSGSENTAGSDSGSNVEFPDHETYLLGMVFTRILGQFGFSQEIQEKLANMVLQNHMMACSLVVSVYVALNRDGNLARLEESVEMKFGTALVAVFQKSQSVQLRNVIGDLSIAGIDPKLKDPIKRVIGEIFDLSEGT